MKGTLYNIFANTDFVSTFISSKCVNLLEKDCITGDSH